ncbi:MAG: hypothetical protein ACRDTC_15455 [Pseudonocardiaceae bacterium]
MRYKVRSLREEQAWLAADLRAQGKTWGQVAEVFRTRYRINARVALRLVRSWSQSRAAEEWNRYWPDEPKTFKNFSYWESWPSSTGHAPSLNVLGRLARIYQCSISDLVVDLFDYRHQDSAHQAPEVTSTAVALPDESLLVDLLGKNGGEDRGILSPFFLPGRAASLHRWLDRINYHELVQVIVMWMQRINPSFNRRQLMYKLSAAFTMAAAQPFFDTLDSDEHEQVVQVLRGASNFSEPALHYCAEMVSSLRRQDNVLGPRFILHSALGHRNIAHGLAKSAPAEFQQAAISVYANLTSFVGWLCSNMEDHPSAQHYYDEARSAAHDAGNIDLVAYILCTMSQLATVRGKALAGIDHAIAAQSWAAQTGNPLAEAYATDVAARAFATDGQDTACRKALETEQTTLARVDSDVPAPPWWYFYNESFFWSTISHCAVQLRDPDRALEAAATSLASSDPTDVHNHAYKMLWQGAALVQKEEIAEASRVVGEVVTRTATNTSLRIHQRITDLHTSLEPWQSSKPVKELDEVLRAYRWSPSGSNKI